MKPTLPPLPLTLGDLVEVLHRFPFQQAVTTVRLSYLASQDESSTTDDPSRT